MMNKVFYMIKNLSDSKELNIVAAINRIPFHFLPFKTLFKYEYYKYLYSNGYLPLTIRFADIATTPEIEKLHDEISDHFNYLQNIVCIIDQTITNKVFMEIQHSYTMEILSDEDVLALQSESFELLTMFEAILRTGKNKLNNSYTVYYSSRPIDSNCLYYEYDNNIMSQIWLYPESPIIIFNNKQLSIMQKRWLDANIRNSTLISNSNSVLQIKLLKDIHDQISNLHK
jgi:hypothetical protein